jgi:hypothetical protein
MGVQQSNLGHPHCNYAAAGGNPDASDHTSGTTVGHRTSAIHQTTPRADDGLPRGVT